MNVSIAERLASRLGRKLAKTTPFRSDFVIADHRVIDEDRRTAKVLVQFDQDAFGTPSKEDVIATLTHIYKAHDGRPRLVVDPASVQVYPRLQAVACQVEIPAIRRPFEDVKRFKMKEVIAGTVFLGENVSDTWAVAKGENDAIFIERVEKDDIEQILRERAKANAFRVHSGRSSLTLARVEASVGSTMYSHGDVCKVSHGGKLKSGEILGLTEGGAHVRFQDGTQAFVSTASIHGLVEASDAAKAWNKEALKEYFRKAYGYEEADLDKLVSYID
jgi:hypothetical protein